MFSFTFSDSWHFPNYVPLMIHFDVMQRPLALSGINLLLLELQLITGHQECILNFWRHTFFLCVLK